VQPVPKIFKSGMEILTIFANYTNLICLGLALNTNIEISYHTRLSFGKA
jgi:hypothetical protein